jgi:zinc transport system substrate-binding protein
MLKKAFPLFLLFSLVVWGKINLAVSIAPEAFIVEKIASNLADITTIVKAGSSPHTYEPKPSEMKALSKAKLYFAIGVEFEKSWLKRFKDLNPNLQIVHVDKNITKYPISNDEKKGHLDPHIWLDPINLKIIAKNISDALIAVDKDNKAIYEKNLKKFLNEMDSLDNYIKTTLSPITIRKFLVFHPSWGYYARRYNLEQIAIEIAGKKPKPKELISIIKTAQKNNIKVIIAQPEFSTKSATIIANEIGGKVIKVSPMQKNIVANLKKITDTIAQANRE